jgi:protein SCO1/2
MTITERLHRHSRKLALGALAALALGAGGVQAWQTSRPLAAPGFASVAALDLRGVDGRRFDFSSLSGRPVAVFFGFTNCPDVCPMTLQRLARMRGRIGNAYEGLEVVFVTLDPERDSGVLLKDYMAAQPVRVTGLTGSSADVARAAVSFGVFHERVATSETAYTIDHTASLYLVARDGSRAGEISFDASDGEFEQKLRAIL